MLTTLVAAFDRMTAEVVTAIPQPGEVREEPTERKTGLEPAIRALRTLRARDGGLDLLRGLRAREWAADAAI